MSAATTCSITLPKTLVTDTGLQLAGFDEAPFLKMGAIMALFRADGILPIDKKDENNNARGSANADTNCFTKNGE